MEVTQIFSELNKNLSELNIIEHDMSRVEVALYQKSLEQAKNNRLNSLRLHFEKQAKTYSQRLNKHEKKIDNILKSCEKQIVKLIKRYDGIYMEAFENMQFARNNQKIATANIVTIKAQTRSNDENEVNKSLEKNMLLCAQKKLNYAIIIEECEARINWCIENVVKDIDNLFSSSWNQIEIYNNSIWAKIRDTFINKIFGKSKYEKLLLNYENDMLNNIKTRINQRNAELEMTLIGVSEQMKDMRRQIKTIYDSMIINQIA